MVKRIKLFVTLMLVGGLLISTAGAVPVIVGFKETADLELVQQQGKLKHSYKHIPAVAADLPEEAIEKMKKNSKIAYIEPDYEVRVLEDELPWGINRIDADIVHSTNKGTGVKIAIIDTGIDYNHPELDNYYRGGYDFINGDNDPMDDYWHGTHCAGIVAAEDNEIGVIGVAPEVELYGLKVMDSSGSGSTSDVAAAIDWAIGNNIQIISMSLGTDYNSLTLGNACNKAYNEGILLVAAAGNDGTSSVDYPAKYDSVIAVAATSSSDTKASFSNTGPEIELAAPGVSVKSTYLGGGYISASGTSMACPHVAGTAALVWAANPGWDNTQVRSRLQETAEDLGYTGWDSIYGFGLVDAEAAVSIPIPDDSTPPADPIPDITEPGISNVKSTVATDSVTITWDTDEAGDSTFRYSINPELSGAAQIYDPSFTTTHTVELTGLTPETTYYYEVRSTDESGNPAIDNNNGAYYNFTTLAKALPAEMHVSGIGMEIQKAGINTEAVATVSVVDANGAPVEGATVYGSWSGLTTKEGSSGVTDSDGKVVFTSGKIKRVNSGTFTFTVNNVAKDGWGYNLQETVTSASIQITA